MGKETVEYFVVFRGVIKKQAQNAFSADNRNVSMQQKMLKLVKLRLLSLFYYLIARIVMILVF